MLAQTALKFIEVRDCSIDLLRWPLFECKFC